MENIDAMKPTQDERIMAALSHIAAIIPFMGVIAPIVIWVTQKDKSRYVGFQALQAMAYQILDILVMFLGYACYMVFFFGTFASAALFAATSNKDPMMNSPELFMILPFGVILLLGISQMMVILYGIVAAIFSLQGKPFRYLIIGKRIERYIQKNGEHVSPSVP
jgi:uncharacterized protein